MVVRKGKAPELEMRRRKHDPGGGAAGVGGAELTGGEAGWWNRRGITERW